MSKVTSNLVIDVILAEIARQMSGLNDTLADAQTAADMHRLAKDAGVALADIQHEAQSVIERHMNRAGVKILCLDGATAGYKRPDEIVFDEDVWAELCKENVTYQDAQTRFKDAERVLEVAKKRLYKLQEQALARYIRPEDEFYIKHKGVGDGV